MTATRARPSSPREPLSTEAALADGWEHLRDWQRETLGELEDIAAEGQPAAPSLDLPSPRPTQREGRAGSFSVARPPQRRGRVAVRLPVS